VRQSAAFDAGIFHLSFFAQHIQKLKLKHHKAESGGAPPCDQLLNDVTTRTVRHNFVFKLNFLRSARSLRTTVQFHYQQHFDENFNCNYQSFSTNCSQPATFIKKQHKEDYQVMLFQVNVVECTDLEKVVLAWLLILSLMEITSFFISSQQLSANRKMEHHV